MPGDIVLIQTGDVLAADLRLIKAAALKTNEMILTGESEDVKKSVRPSPQAIKSYLNPPNMVCFIAFSSVRSPAL